MPVNIEIGCDGTYHISSNGKMVRAETLAAVHKSIDHHYRGYVKDGSKHSDGLVKGCPFCEG